VTTSEWRYTRTPIGLIALEELARVLYVWAARGFVPTTIAALSSWALNTSAMGPRVPDPRPAISLMARLGLAYTLEDGGVLPDHGLIKEGYVTERTDRFDQRVVVDILERMLEHSEFRKELRCVFKYFHIKSGLPVVQWRTVPDEMARCPGWIWLQQLGLGEHIENCLIGDERLIPFLLDNGWGTSAVSVDELEERLKLQRERSGMAEEFVVRVERERLRRAGMDDLAEDVERISLRNVGAGFDIRSYDLTGARRYIEVKSSAGPRERFFLSRNEMTRAEEGGDEYWLAWLGWTARLPSGPVDLAWFRNPAGLLRLAIGPWIIEASDLVVARVDSDLDFQTQP
jgi:Domain of unknown function (DUF3883)